LQVLQNAGIKANIRQTEKTRNQDALQVLEAKINKKYIITHLNVCALLTQSPFVVNVYNDTMNKKFILIPTRLFCFKKKPNNAHYCSPYILHKSKTHITLGAIFIYLHL
jgi:hypothetical protein